MLSVRLIGHRGFGKSQLSKIPENTLKSFKKLESYNIKWTETDIQLTSDKIPILFHDFTLNNKYIGNYSFNELNKLVKEITGESLCTLESLLRDTNLNINAELKYPSEVEIDNYKLADIIDVNGFIEPIIKVFEKYNRKIIFSCFTPEILKCLKFYFQNNNNFNNNNFVKNYSHNNNSHNNNFNNNNFDNNNSHNNNFVKNNFENNNFVNNNFDKYQMMFLFCKNEKGDLRTVNLTNAIDFSKKFNLTGIVLEAELATSDNLQLLKAHDLEVYIYGENIENTDDLKKFIDYGVTGFIVDDVVKALSSLNTLEVAVNLK
ncbi:hypothetical protein DMUE_1585 [Dictyocoela muelleri]|nr:hypothetical protein DMUE_1585 [Dictyocoela muelleri]